MPPLLRPAPWLLAFAICWSLLLPATGNAQEADPDPAVSAEELDGLITTLEDEAARQRLLSQLKALRAAQAEAAPDSAVESATADLFAGLSQRLNDFSAAALHLTAAVNRLPEGWAWLGRQFTDPSAQRQWGEVLGSLLLVLGAGYAAFLVVALLLRGAKRRLAARAPPGRGSRAFSLVLLFLLRLLPIGAFLASAYLTLAFTAPGESARLVAVAWIAAFAVARLVQALSHLLFAPEAPALRVLPLDDASAAYADIWVRRLNVTAVYGYFLLQALLLLGLHEGPYLLLSNLLGLAVAALLVALVIQNRGSVARHIRCPEGLGHGHGCALRNRLAGTWHLLAIFYIAFLFGAWALRLPGGFTFLARATALSLLVLLLARLGVFLLRAVFARTLRAGQELEEQFPGIQKRANDYLPWVETAFRWLIYALAALALLQAWGLGTLEWLSTPRGQELGLSLLKVVLITLAALGIWTFASTWLESRVARLDITAGMPSARTRTLVGVASNALLVVVSTLAILLVLSEIGIDIAPLLAGAGVVGLAVGFGAQTLVKDVITGTFILVQNHMSVGEVVKVGDTAGVVEALSIRHVRLRDLSGTVHTIPFSSITSISNLTKDFSYHVFEVGVAYREDPDEVMDVLRAIGGELQADPEYGPLILEPLEIFGLDKFADSAVIIKGRIKTPPIKQWMVGREFNRRVKQRFDALGIEIPFPHRTLYFGIDKAGDAPPARVRLDERLERLAAGSDGGERG